MRYTISFGHLLKGLKYLLEMLQKGICYPLEFINKSKDTLLFNDFKKFFLWFFALFELQYLLTNKTFKI